MLSPDIFIKTEGCMKRIFSILALLMFSVIAMAGEPYDWMGISKGGYADVYTVFFATTPYNAMTAADAAQYTDYEMHNISTVDVWYDFDVTVSTGQTANPTASQLLNGYITGDDGILRAGQTKSLQGKNDAGLWFRTALATGAKVTLTILKRNQ